MVKLARRLHLPKASSDRKATVLEIKKAGISFRPHVEPAQSSPSGEVILEGKDIHYTYPGAAEETLKGISFTVKKGASQPSWALTVPANPPF